ncbi:Response regulator receiver domain-containing protein [Salinihabitans flavidus]|uniref:Response regulator receiver domain-containing protein n=1 Tax=Salinihabitans flavidus TaxID=569882 RepID=A0A1H8UY23_9RHOB|nr:response regulator [Salinihabitans flavidus]SEP07844.1 Response regulator receiver domain-containing protein [Salinihabitans flavidus]
MEVLIAESETELGELWKRHLERMGANVALVGTHDAAIELLRDHAFDVIVLDLVLQDGGALAISDFASYRHPETRVIFVTNTSFFSDGSIFNLSPNACAFVRSGTPPEDLAAMVEYHARR